MTNKILSNFHGMLQLGVVQKFYSTCPWWFHSAATMIYFEDRLPFCLKRSQPVKYV